MNKLTLFMMALVAGTAVQTQTLAMEHGHMAGHGDTSAMAQDQASVVTRAQGVINAVDTEAGSVNLTHGPIPALNWPAMTMDLPVTDQVDLSGVSAGDAVDFGIVLGGDDVYRITELKKQPD